MRSQAINKIIIHCSASQDDDAKDIGVAEIRRDHVNRNGWNDIGYHYVIRRNGAVEIGRKELVRGAHCKGYNEGSIGICLVGTKHFNQIQITKLAALYNDIYKRHGVSYNNVYCHYQFNKHKTCPNIPIEVLRFIFKNNSGIVFLAESVLNNDVVLELEGPKKVRALRRKVKVDSSNS